jgi:hypothetical protein
MGHTKMRKYTRKVVIEEKEYKDLKRDRKILFRIKSDKKDVNDKIVDRMAELRRMRRSIHNNAMWR